MQGDREPPMERPVRAVIVDDSVPLLETLVDALAAQPSVDVVATAVDGEQAVRVVGEVRPDVVLLDLRLGDSWGLDLVPVLRAGEEPPAVVVFSASDTLTLESALVAGAHAQVVKGASVEEIVAVLRAAAVANHRDPTARS